MSRPLLRMSFKNPRKVIIFALGAVYAAYIALLCGIDIAYSSWLPPSADPQNGRVYQMVVNHGFTCYGTLREYNIRKTLLNLFPLAIVGFFLIFIFGLKWGILRMGPGRKLFE
jgi:hypothetical protein